MMVDHRYDRGGALLARDEVVRLREFLHRDGRAEVKLSWKGPTTVTPEGYKSRRELEFEIRPRGPESPPAALLEALGFEEVQRIERYVEYYRLGGAEIRLEWYPRMDVLIEIEGDQGGIETAREVIGLPRSAYSAEPLPAFTARYAERTGTPAALSIEALRGEAPSWDKR